MLETKRTILRKFQKEDLSSLHDYTSVTGVGERAGWKHHDSIEETEFMLAQLLKNENAYAIVIKETQTVVGHITVHDDSEAGRADTKELGFVMNPVYQNKGIMTEAIKAILEDLFSKDTCYVYACCFQENAASKYVIEKCGFQFEQEGEFFSESMSQLFASYEYVYTRERWYEDKTAN